MGDTKKPLNETERRALELYNKGFKQSEMVRAMQKNKSTISRALKRVKEDYPELLKVSEKVQIPVGEHKPKNSLTVEKEFSKQYLKLDLGTYGEYLRTMAGFRHVSLTKYIQGLISEDMDKNSELFEKLESLQ